MTNYVTLNGNTYSDGASDEGLGIRYLDNGGHWNYLIPMFSDVVTTAGNVATIGSQVAAVATAASATSLAIAIASKTFITAASVVGFAVGNYVRVQSRANTANFMYGKITAYSGTSLTVDVQVIGGSGTFADWDIWLAGMRGASGSADTTAITGILKGNGSVTSQAIAGTDYLSPTAPALSAETFSTAATITAGTNAQGQGALTSDHNVITTAAANPSGVTLPTATIGRRIVIINKGANPINVYPASGGYIDALAINTSIQIPVAGMMVFYASSTTQWYSTANLRLPNKQDIITATGILKGAGAGSVSAAVAGTDYQAAITASGLLKGAGAGSVSAAVAGTDYQAAISASGILKGAGAGSISAAVAGTDYQTPLVSGTSIKTIDSVSLLGSGNIALKDTTAQTGLLKGNGSSISAVVSGTDIKTINSTSVIGSGDIKTNSRNYTATGSIASAGIAVALRNDGTVSAIAGNLSSDVTFSSANLSNITACYVQSTGSVVVAWFDAVASLVKCAVGTVSGGTISFGTVVTPSFFGTMTTMYSISIAAQPASGKVVISTIFYGGATTNYQGIVGTISGSSISFGSYQNLGPTQISGTVGGASSLSYDSVSDKFLWAFSSNSAGYYGASYVLTISGTTISSSSIVNFYATATAANHFVSVFDSTNGKHVLFYNRADVIYAIVGTISAGVVSYGTEVTCYSGRGYYLSACYDSFNGKIALAFVNTATDSQCRVIIGTVSGTTISFGTAVVASANTCVATALAYDSINHKILLAFGYNDAPLYVKAVTGTISGTTVTFGTQVNISPSGYSASGALAIAYDPGNNSAVVAYKGVSNYGNARVSSMSSGDFNLGLTNFIGISETSAANGASVSVTNIGGVNTNVSGLSTGSKYYVDSAGALTTSAVSGVEAGKALSATSLLVTGG